MPILDEMLSYCKPSYAITKEQELSYDLKKVKENIKLLQDRERQLESDLRRLKHDM